MGVDATGSIGDAMKVSPAALRAIEAGEFEEFSRATEMVFGEQPDDEAIASWRQRLELDRTLAAFDRERIVATTAAHTYRVTVPGGDIPMAGVTAVSVRPTHRRRGLLRALMARQLADLRREGEAVAGLWASEASIYGRFGYGPATWQAIVELDRTWSAQADPVPIQGRTELVEPADAVDAFGAVYEAARARRPGMISWSRADWLALLGRDPQPHREGIRHAVLFEDRGAALYRVKINWDQTVADGLVSVELLVASDPEAEAGLWRYLSELDLVSKVEALMRPADEPLALRLADPRRLRTSVADALWIRLVRVGEALESRTYGADGALVLEIRDPVLRGNDGRLKLAVDGGHAKATRTKATPDLTVHVGHLGAAFLGGTPLARWAQAGLVDEHTVGALERLDRMCWSPVAPWCALEF